MKTLTNNGGQFEEKKKEKKREKRFWKDGSLDEKNPNGDTRSARACRELRYNAADFNGFTIVLAAKGINNAGKPAAIGKSDIDDRFAREITRLTFYSTRRYVGRAERASC